MKISVYITSYNQKEYLVEAIESVLAQSLPAHQIIIVDDCSQDGSQDLISGYATRYPAITPIFHRENQGVSQARNDALAAVTGDYVTYVDGDDRILPAKLEKEAKRLRENAAAQIAFSDVYHIKADGTRMGTWAARKKPPQGDVFCQTFGRDFPGGNLFRNELVDYHAWRQIGFYDPSLSLYEDYDMRIRLTKRLRVSYHDEPLSEYRRHAAGLRNVRAEQKLAAFDYICKKNNALLQDLDAAQQRYVQHKLDHWRAHLVRMGAKEMVGAWQPGPIDKKQALELYLQSLSYHRYLDLDLVLGLILPHRLYSALRASVRKA